MPVRIQQFEPIHLEAAHSLSSDAGWNQTQNDWMRIVRYQPEGCFVALDGCNLVGTVTTTGYRSTLGWIGMMLVAESHRRCGIATKLMKQAIWHLENQKIRCIKLDATPLGRLVYERLGFEPEMEFHRWQRQSRHRSGEPGISPDPVSKLTHPDLDQIAFGADRSRLLDQLNRDSRTVSGETSFAMLRPGRLADYLGPVVSQNAAEARQLILLLLDQAAGDVFWDVPSDNAEAVSMARNLRFKPVRDLIRMRRGEIQGVPEYGLQFALADPGTG